MSPGHLFVLIPVIGSVNITTDVKRSAQASTKQAQHTVALAKPTHSRACFQTDSVLRVFVCLYTT